MGSNDTTETIIAAENEENENEDDATSFSGDPNSFWSHWILDVKIGNKQKVKCRYCKGHIQLKNRPKCKRHLLRCPKTPDDVKIIISSQKVKGKGGRRIRTIYEEMDEDDNDQGEDEMDEEEREEIEPSCDLLEYDDDSQNLNNSIEHNDSIARQLNNIHSDKIWLHWVEIPSLGKPKVKCKYCGAGKQLKNAPKCRSHTMKCKLTPKFIRDLYKKKAIQSGQILKSNCSPISSDASDYNGDDFDFGRKSSSSAQKQLLDFKRKEHLVKLKMYHIEMMHFKRKSELEIELLKKQIRNEELKFRKLSGENDEIQVTTE